MGWFLKSRKTANKAFTGVWKYMPNRRHPTQIAGANRWALQENSSNRMDYSQWKMKKS
jgi:hypothetical protein